MIPFLQPAAANTPTHAPTLGDTPSASGGALTFAELLDGFPADEDAEKAEVDVALDAAEIDLDQGDDSQLAEMLGGLAHPILPSKGRDEGRQIEVEPAARSAPVENVPVSRDGAALKAVPTEAPEKHAQLFFESQLAPSPEQLAPHRARDIPHTVAGIRIVAQYTPRLASIAGLGAPKTAEGDGLDRSKLTQITLEQNPKVAAPDQSRSASRQQLSELAPASHYDLVSLPGRPAMVAPATVAFQRQTFAAYVPVMPTEIEPLFVVQADRVVQAQVAVSQPSPTVQVDTARHVASQIAVAVTERAGRPTEISLNPEELGRVRMTMSAIDTAITLTVSAERQETSDLLRKHIETLSQEFRELGYDDISFTFGQRESAPQADQSETDGSYDQADDAEEVLVQQETKTVGTNGLDIKL